MEGLRNYQAAQSGFAGAAEEMNENAAAFRGKVSNIKNENKSLVQQFKTATDMKALKGIGEEAAVRAFKTYGGKAMGWIDKKAFGGKISSDTEGFKNILEKKGKALYQSAKDRLSNRGQGQGNEMEDDGETGTEMTGGETDVVGGESPGDGTFGDGGEVGTEGVEDGEELGGREWSELTDAEREQELFGHTDDRVGEQAGRTQPERTLGDESNRAPNETDEGTQQEDTETKEGDEGDDAENEDAPDEQGDLGDTLEEGAEDLGEGAGEGLADEAGGDALIGAGTALDATGIGAVVGIPLQIAGAVLEGGALYEAGKSVVDWFEDDILGMHPKVPQVKIPKAAPTLAQQGLIAAPVYDTSMDMPSSSSAF